MSTPDLTTQQRERTGLRYLAAAFIVLIFSVALNIWRPLWLAGSWVRLTPLLYCLVLQAWLPLLIISLNHSPRRRPALSTLLLLAFGALQCLCILTLPAQDTVNLTLRGTIESMGVPSMGSDFVCQPSVAARLTCELCVWSSDNPGLSRTTYTFRGLDPLPLLYLVEYNQTDSRQEPGLTCPIKAE